MGILVGVSIGFLLAVYGFLAMRNPLRFRYVMPGSEGYLQRLVLDSTQRNQLRLVAVTLCLCGITFGCLALSFVWKSKLANRIVEAYGMLLACTFVLGFCVGVALSVRQLFTGETFDWLRAWSDGRRLGPVSVTPAVTPAMEREATLFTAIFVGLLLVTGVVAVFR